MYITLIVIAVIIFVIGNRLFNTWDYGGCGTTLCVISALFLIIHLFAGALKTYDYKCIVANRDALKFTIEQCRGRENTYESAMLSGTILKFNVDLKRTKMSNKTFFFDQYIDDRIELIEPLK